MAAKIIIELQRVKRLNNRPTNQAISWSKIKHRNLLQNNCFCPIYWLFHKEEDRSLSHSFKGSTINNDKC